ncbi:MAG: hypothetical protein NVS4B3_22770 [Gemmatimonadaceae bacterium]
MRPIAPRCVGPARPSHDRRLLALRDHLYDFINRAMPFDAPGSLEPHEVYAVVAYLLHRNGIIAPNIVLSDRTLPLVPMPARDRRVIDDRKGGDEVR